MKNRNGSLVRPDVLPESASRPVVTPLSPTVVYASDTPDVLDAQYGGQLPGYTYAREGHPNADVLAARIDRLEHAPSKGIMTGSGMAAVGAVLMGLCKTGDHVIGSSLLYGRSLRMMTQDLPRMGIETTLVDPADPAALRAAVRPNTRLIMTEVVSNPTLRVADIKAMAQIARAAGALFVVDNTFTTPLAFQPFEHGADIVVHSVTKLLAGHADVTLGYVNARDASVSEVLEVFAVTMGLTASPFDCWLAERGLLTFELRYRQAQDTARRLADHLAELPGIRRVIYPMRDDHPDIALARDVLGQQGCNMVSFEVAPSRAAANALVEACEGIAFAPTLGDIGTTLSHPSSSSHRALSPQDQAAMGLSEGFFRVSVGLEDPDALCDVFARGVAAAERVGAGA
jgi:cystathionine gamma-synthase/methionine-gamma-lyase